MKISVLHIAKEKSIDRQRARIHHECMVIIYTLGAGVVTILILMALGFK